MKFPLTFTVILLTSAAMIACAPKAQKNQEPQEPDYDSLTAEQMLEVMRTDTVWIHKLDSMAAINIGPGAQCVDAVKHTFRWDGRLWVYNHDWGGVLEIPEGFVPFDDIHQAVVSYHGSGIRSSDTFVYISHYEGLQTSDYEEFKSYSINLMEKDSLFAQIAMREDSLTYHSGMTSPAIVFETLSVDGIKGYFKNIFSSPEDVEYCISIQYPADMEDRYGYIREMVDRYPFGPLGQDPKKRE